MNKTSQSSVLAAACMPAVTPWLATVADNAQDYALGQLTVQVRVSATFGADVLGNTKIKSVKGTGTALSIAANPTVSAARDHQVQLAKAEGVSARGIPPRGRPV